MTASNCKKEYNPIPVILDGDPGHDDAIAWLLATASPAIDVKAITTVAGNVALDKTTYNALRICTLLRQNAPIAQGAPHPLQADLMVAPSVHGESGLDGPALPEPDRALYDGSAVELMAQTLRESADKITIISTGPLTNTASLLLAHPELKSKIERISLMGGGIGFGNWTPAAEFNILVDPEAAEIVFTSGLPILMAGLDVTERALMYREDFEAIKAIGNPVSDIVWQWLEFFYRFHQKLGYAGAPMHDPCAVMALIHPEIFTMQDLHVTVETAGEFTRGTTVGDRRGLPPKTSPEASQFAYTAEAPNATCIMDVDRDRFASYLIDAVKSFS